MKKLIEMKFMLDFLKKNQKNFFRDPLAFSYQLKAADLPSGDLTFSFEVRNSEGVHTSKKVIYSITTPMVASEIQISQPKLK